MSIKLCGGIIPRTLRELMCFKIVIRAATERVPDLGDWSPVFNLYKLLLLPARWVIPCVEITNSKLILLVWGEIVTVTNCTGCFPRSRFFFGLFSWLVVNSLTGVYPLFRCNAANLAGAAVRVHIVLSSTSAALPSRLLCAKEYRNSEDEGTEKAPDLSQRVSENQSQKLDIVSSEIANGKPQEDDAIFLENTVAVNILVERAMHLSLKGKFTTTPLFSLLFSFFPPPPSPPDLFVSGTSQSNLNPQTYSNAVNGCDGFWTWLHSVATPRALHRCISTGEAGG